jgi:hypothetical protein
MPRAVVAFLIASLALPAVAQGQGSGVVVDPDSPAGTEYAIPLEEARRQGAPDREQRGGGRNADPPLFGEGIERAPSASAAGGVTAGSAGGGEGSGGEGSGGAGGGGDRGADKAADGEVLGAQQTESERPRGSMAVEAAARGGSDALLTAGIAGTVLAVGLLVGFVLRRVLRSE